MKNLVLLLLLFPLSAAAQENLMRTDTTFHPNGKMAVIETKDVSLNVRSGWYQVYDSCGQLLVSGTFAPATKVLCSYCHQWDEIYDKFIVTDSVEVAEMRIGRWSYYYPNGQLKETGRYCNCAFKSFEGNFTDQEVDEKTHFEFANARLADSLWQHREGWWAMFDECGRLTGREFYTNGMNTTTEGYILSEPCDPKKR